MPVHPGRFAPTGMDVGMESSETTDGPRFRRRIAMTVLAALTLAVFAPSLRYGFINYDDSMLVKENPLIRELGPRAIARMFSRWSETSYYPVRLLSFAVDYAFWGLKAAGYHITNVLLHIANALLLFALMLRMGTGEESGESGSEPERARPGGRVAGRKGGGGKTPSRRGSEPAAGLLAWGWLPAFLGAVFFAVHPLVVEPVAWIGGREEVLMLFFGLLCLHAHAGAGGARWWSAGRRVVAGVCCVAATFSNVLGATLPMIVSAYEWAFRRAANAAPRQVLARILRATWYYWLAGMVAVALKVKGNSLPHAQDYGSPELGVIGRVMLVLSNYWLNVRNVVWPHNLVLAYPNQVPDEPIEYAGVLVGACLAAGTVWGLWVLLRRRRAWFGLAWFVLALGPSAQVVPHHVFRADRFLYLPLAGAAQLAAWALGRTGQRQAARRLVVSAAALYLAALGIRSLIQERYWRDSVSVFSRSADVYPLNWIAQNNLAVALAEGGNTDGAYEQISKALRVSPDYAEGHNNLGNVLMRQGKYDEAVKEYSEALRIRPGHADAHFNIANVYAKTGDSKQALFHYKEALRLNPKDAEAHLKLGALLDQMRVLREAEFHYGEAARLAPNDIKARLALGDLYADTGRVAEAAEAYRAAQRAASQSAEPPNSLGILALRLGRTEEALQHFSRSLQLNPAYSDAHNNLGIAFARQDRFPEAEAHYRQALRDSPGFAQAHYNLGNVLVLQGRVDEAIREYSEALRLRPDEARVHAKLGVTLAGRGETGSARAHLSEALKLDPEYEEARSLLNELRGAGDP
ncbi:MAG: tetratricopeptide repeat protein [Kiritimatiellae bacterium]|nr:tetratricopeptide repeat protein [Kiritimatiellia bacterium]